MFEKLAGMLRNLESAQGAKRKEELLKQYVVDPDFVWMAKLALDQGHSFGIEEFPVYSPGAPHSTENIVAKLEELAKSAGVSDNDVNMLWVLACSSPETYLVVDRIIHKDLRCGVQAKTINRVSPGLIFRVPYQRCGSPDRIDKMTWPALLQRKANGMFAYIMPEGDFMTRRGNRFTIPENRITPFLKGLPGLNNNVLMGELIIVDANDQALPRAEGNGIVNSFLKGSDEYADRAKDVRAYVWNLVDQHEFLIGRSSVSYRDVWGMLGMRLPLFTPVGGGIPVKLIEHWWVKDLSEAQEITNQLIAAGEEGTVVKSLRNDFVWRDESSSDFQIKLKAVAEAEFIIVDAYEGDKRKKWAGKLGGIRVRSACGQIESDVGGGFSDKEREMGVEAWKARAGVVVTVKFNGLSTDRNRPGVYALDHPNKVEVREDKTEADTLEYCQAQLKGGLK